MPPGNVIFSEMRARLDRLTMPVVASLTLGLAPFFPMPHIMEKMTWLASGHAFRTIDIFDVIMHGSPWIWLLWSVVALWRAPRGAEEG